MGNSHDHAARNSSMASTLGVIVRAFHPTDICIGLKWHIFDDRYAGRIRGSIASTERIGPIGCSYAPRLASRGHRLKASTAATLAPVCGHFSIAVLLGISKHPAHWTSCT